MLDDALAHFKRKIEPRKIQIPLLELLDDPQRVKIVIEALSVLAHARIELAFACVSKWRMADVVDERESFGEIGIDPQRARHGARDLRNLQRVRQPVAEMVGEARGENLSLRFETAKRAGMQHAVAIAGVVVAVGMLRFRKTASARPPHIHGVRFERHRCHSSVSGWTSATFCRSGTAMDAGIIGG